MEYSPLNVEQFRDGQSNTSTKQINNQSELWKRPPPYLPAMAVGPASKTITGKIGLGERKTIECCQANALIISDRPHRLAGCC